MGGKTSLIFLLKATEYAKNFTLFEIRVSLKSSGQGLLNGVKNKIYTDLFKAILEHKRGISKVNIVIVRLPRLYHIICGIKIFYLSAGGRAGAPQVHEQTSVRRSMVIKVGHPS